MSPHLSRNMEYLPALLQNCTRALSKARHTQKPAFKRPFVMLRNETKMRQNGRSHLTWM